MILFKLLLAHFLGDFVLQPKSWVVEKEQKKLRSIRFYAHIFVHGLLMLLFLWDWQYWPVILSLTLLHGFIDTIKIYAQEKNNKSKYFFIDQALHLLSIAIVCIFWYQPTIPYHHLFSNPTFWLLSITFIFITFVSSVIIRVAMSHWSKAIDEEGDESLNKAGQYIGILERLLTFIFILSGHWGAVGFLLAAKSVFRFGNLKEAKDRKLTEYILIGTLLSFGIAIVAGIAISHSI